MFKNDYLWQDLCHSVHALSTVNEVRTSLLILRDNNGELFSEMAIKGIFVWSMLVIYFEIFF